MDITTFVSMLGLTVFIAILCVGGMYANAHRDEQDNP